MPLAVFRRHQKVMLVVIGLFAMFGFVAGSTTMNIFSGDPRSADNVEVARIFDQGVKRSEINEFARERVRANRFMYALLRTPQFESFFGQTDTRSIVDALILRHEAQAMGLPATVELGRDWLKKLTGGALDETTFEKILAENYTDNPISGDRLLLDVAEQARIEMYLRLMISAEPPPSPLQFFEGYRDESEQVSALAVPFRVADYVNDKSVGTPTDAQIRDLYERYKNVLPDADSPSPGFKVPRRVRTEFVWLDGAALADDFRKHLSAKELRDEYEDRKLELGKLLRDRDELPVDVFGGDPEGKLTPRTFAESREFLTTELAERKVTAEVENKFGKMREEMMDPYQSAYEDYLHPEAEDGKPQAQPNPGTVPPPVPDLKKAAEKLGLSYEKTPLLTRESAAEYGKIHLARVGTKDAASFMARDFAAETFRDEVKLFEPLDFSDSAGSRYLVWKIADEPDHVPPLEEVRADVVDAWKIDKARPLAITAAEALKKKAEAAKGDLRAVAGTRIVTTSDIARRFPNSFETGLSREAEIPEIPHAGDSFRETYFNLQAGQVAVAADLPKTTYYVLGLKSRKPVEFATFMMPLGPYKMQGESLRQTETYRRRDQLLKELRAKAKLPADWAPADERKRKKGDSSPADEA